MVEPKLESSNKEVKIVEDKISNISDIKSKFPVRETRSSLPLQMALHFHSFLDPIIYISLIGCFIIKYEKVHPTYRVILFAMLLISISIEIIRPYLGLYGNLGERIPALSGFWITTLILQIPISIFLLVNPEIYPLPLEKFLLFFHLFFLFVEAWCSFFLVRILAEVQVQKFKAAISTENKEEKLEQISKILPEEINVNILPKNFTDTIFKKLSHRKFVSKKTAT